MKKPVRLSLTKQIANEIEIKIESKSWPIGTKIPTESQLAKQFEVSRNTIREALQSLIQVGVLEARPGDGTYVLASGKFEANMYHQLSLAKAEEVIEARCFLEKNLAYLAAQNRTDNDLAIIKNAWQVRLENQADLERLVETDGTFHLEIARAAHNSVLFELYQAMTSYIYQVLLSKLTDEGYHNAELSNKLHEELIQAIIDQDSHLSESLAAKIITL